MADITGETGLKIVRAIVAGERDPLTLARLRHPSCKSSEETIAKALTGHWQEEQLFVLQQSLELYALTPPRRRTSLPIPPAPSSSASPALTSSPWTASVPVSPRPSSPRSAPICLASPLAALQRKAAQLGFELTPKAAPGQS